MLNCSRCSADYSEQGLDNGRCRNCGHVVSWSATAVPNSAIAWPTDDSSVPIGDISETPREAHETLDGFGEPDPVKGEPEQVDPDSEKLETESEDAATVRALDATIALDSNAVKQTPSAIVQKQWATLAPEGKEISATIMTNSTEVGMSDHLVIPRRSVRNSDEALGKRTDYELIEVIGQGGEGIVHAARQASIDRTVALKMIRSGLGEAAHARDKFLSEAVVTGDLEHPNIVPIYDLGTTNDGSPFYVMKRIEGTPWSEVIGRKSLMENLSILMRTADAVALAHSRGVVHRDLKPENIMLGGFGEVLLTDWGIALCTEQFAKRSSVVILQGLGGTPAYMAPEMATGPIEAIGPAADVYLLGAMLYEIVSGHPPHHADTVMGCLHAASRNEIQPTDVKGELIEIARRAMATDPRSRHESVKDFQESIAAYQSHSESVLLANQARQDLQKARRDGSYKDYAAALFGFQKAVELWTGNQDAQKALSSTASFYADAALQKGDLDLALSLLDPNASQHDKLRKKIIAAQAERNARLRRLQTMRYVAAGLLFAILGGGSYAILRVMAAKQVAESEGYRATVAAANAKHEAKQAELQRVAAVEATELAIAREMEAKLAREQAEAAAQEAHEQRGRSEKARREADAALRRAEVASYTSNISLAVSSIANNAFSDALGILSEQRDNPQTTPLRHWEWGRLMYLCSGGDPDAAQGAAVTTLPTEAEAMAVAVSPDRRRIAAPDMAGSIFRWRRDDDDPDGPWMMSPTIPGSVPVNDVVYSNDGLRLASAGDDGIIRIYQLDNLDAPALQLEGHRMAVLSLAVSPTVGSNLLASASADRTIRLWNIETGTLVRTLVGHTAEVWSVAFSAQADRLVTASQDFTARVWSVRTGLELQRFREHSEPVFCAAFSPDGKSVTSGGYDKRLLVWKADRFEPVQATLVDEVIKRLDPNAKAKPKQAFRVLAGHSGGIRDVQYSADGQLIISASRDNTLRVWDADPSTQATGVRQQLRSALQGAVAEDQPLKTLRGHGGWVTSGQFLSPSTVVSSAYDRSVKIWSLLRYEPTISLASIDRPVLSGTYSPDGRNVVLALDDGTAGVWDTVSGKRTSQLQEGHDFLATTAAFLPGADRLVTVAGDDTTRLWDVQHGAEVWSVGGTGRRGLLALSPNGNQILTGSSDGKVAQLFEVETGRKIRQLGVDQFAALASQYPDATRRELESQIPDITAVSFAPRGGLIATADSFGVCRLWAESQDEPKVVFRGHDAAVTCLQWLPNADVLVTASADSSVAFWDASSGEELPGPRLQHDDSVSLLTVSDDGTHALCVAADGAGGQRLYYWDLMNRTLIARYPDAASRGNASTKEASEKMAINSIAFSPQGDMALVATFEINTSRYQIRQWDFNSGSFDPINEGTLKTGTVFSAVYAQAAAQAILTVGGNGARFWDKEGGQELMNYRPHGSILSVDYAPDGDRIATTGSDRSIKIWKHDEAKGQWISEAKLIGKHVGPINIAKFCQASGDTMLVSGGDDGLAIVWQFSETNHWQPAHTLRGHTAAIHAIAASPDNRWLATASADQTIRLWDLKTNQSVAQLHEHRGEVLAITFSSDSNRLLSGGSDNRAILWDVMTHQPLTQLVGHSAAINAVAFSPDGARVVTCGQDNTLKLWDTSDAALTNSNSGNELLSLSAHDREITAVEFSPDGRQLLSTGLDGKALLYNSVEIR
ncbi:protein kinase domain-containing protein [Novipirellula galeiformis]|uniref:protein kinase domain-containing protein n=1 Tax=Novipirellula galeiformis TaxID=2528004 RepID=UPI0018CC8EC2|nr:protein kinase [Novipirellula galeiformis]